MVQSTNGIVIGIDGGGTHTRIMVVDLTGNVLAYLENGASSIYKDLHARENVQSAIQWSTSYRTGNYCDFRDGVYHLCSN